MERRPHEEQTGATRQPVSVRLLRRRRACRLRESQHAPRDPEGQRRLRACVAERRFRPDGEPEPWLPDFPAFAESVLGWSFSPKGYAGTAESPVPPELETPLQEGGEVLRPDFAVRERDPRDDGSQWQLLVKAIEPGDDFDRVAGGAGRLEVSAHGRMERLLRQTGVPAGLLSNGRTLRLVSAPRGESSGWLDLHVADMQTTAGRPIVAALRLLLSETRLLALPPRQALLGAAGRQPALPERGERAAGRAGAARPLRAAAGACRRPTTRGTASCCAGRWPTVPRTSTTRCSRSSCGSSSCSTRKSGTCCPRARPSRATTRWPASTSACARTRPCIPTR